MTHVCRDYCVNAGDMLDHYWKMVRINLLNGNMVPVQTYAAKAEQAYAQVQTKDEHMAAGLKYVMALANLDMGKYRAVVKELSELRFFSDPILPFSEVTKIQRILIRFFIYANLCRI